MKNIHLIPTDKPSRYVTNYMEQTMQWQHIYLTSEEEIKEGDWYWLEKVGKIGSNSGAYKSTTEKSSKLNTISSNCKKIILTTDQSLDGVQAIDDEFLEWFVKNPSCEEVEVKKGKMKLNDDGEEYGFPDMSLYKIIIPKEPKQETLEEAAEKCFKYIDHRNTFIAGAKWQQERSYSEEEVLNILDKFLVSMLKGEKTGLTEKWFEQFKKKTQ